MELDTRQFDSIYRTYAPQLYRFLRSIGCPEQEAEDVVQETFVKALLRIDSFRGDCQLFTWLCQIAKNTWRDHLKKTKRERPAEVPGTETAPAPSVEWLDMVTGLEEPYRSVFLRVALGGWTYDALAKSYGRTASWARVTYYRARMKLQQMLLDGRNEDET